MARAPPPPPSPRAVESLTPPVPAPSAEAKYYFCDRDNRLPLCFDGFTVDSFDARLTLNAFSQGLQNRQTAHIRLLRDDYYDVLFDDWAA